MNLTLIINEDILYTEAKAKVHFEKQESEEINILGKRC